MDAPVLSVGPSPTPPPGHPLPLSGRPSPHTYPHLPPPPQGVTEPFPYAAAASSYAGSSAEEGGGSAASAPQRPSLPPATPSPLPLAGTAYHTAPTRRPPPTGGGAGASPRDTEPPIPSPHPGALSPPPSVGAHAHGHPVHAGTESRRFEPWYTHPMHRQERQAGWDAHARPPQLQAAGGHHGGWAAADRHVGGRGSGSGYTAVPGLPGHGPMSHPAAYVSQGTPLAAVVGSERRGEGYGHEGDPYGGGGVIHPPGSSGGWTATQHQVTEATEAARWQANVGRVGRGSGAGGGIGGGVDNNDGRWPCGSDGGSGRDCGGRCAGCAEVAAAVMALRLEVEAARADAANAMGTAAVAAAEAAACHGEAEALRAAMMAEVQELHGALRELASRVLRGENEGMATAQVHLSGTPASGGRASPTGWQGRDPDNPALITTDEYPLQVSRWVARESVGHPTPVPHPRGTPSRQLVLNDRDWPQPPARATPTVRDKGGKGCGGGSGGDLAVADAGPLPLASAPTEVAASAPAGTHADVVLETAQFLIGLGAGPRRGQGAPGVKASRPEDSTDRGQPQRLSERGSGGGSTGAELPPTLLPPLPQAQAVGARQGAARPPHVAASAAAATTPAPTRAGRSAATRQGATVWGALVGAPPPPQAAGGSSGRGGARAGRGARPPASRAAKRPPPSTATPPRSGGAGAPRAPRPVGQRSLKVPRTSYRSVGPTTHEPLRATNGGMYTRVRGREGGEAAACGGSGGGGGDRSVGGSGGGRSVGNGEGHGSNGRVGAAGKTFGASGDAAGAPPLASRRAVPPVKAAEGGSHSRSSSVLTASASAEGLDSAAMGAAALTDDNQRVKTKGKGKGGVASGSGDGVSRSRPASRLVSAAAAPRREQRRRPTKAPLKPQTRSAEDTRTSSRSNGRGAGRSGGSAGLDPLPPLEVNPHLDADGWASTGGGEVEMELVTPTGAGGSGRGRDERQREGGHGRTLTGSVHSGGDGGNDKEDEAAAGGDTWSSPTRGAHSQNDIPHSDGDGDDDGLSGSGRSSRRSRGRGCRSGSRSGPEGYGDKEGDVHPEGYGDDDGDEAGDGGDDGGAPRPRYPRERIGASGNAGICGERRRRDNWTDEENDVFIEMVNAHLHMEEMDLRRMLARHFAPRRTHEQCANHLRILRNTGKLPKGNPIV